MRPALDVFVTLMLQFVLPPLEELDQHVPDVRRLALIFDLLDHCLLELVCHDCEGLGRRRLRYLLQKVDAEGVLPARILEKDRLWANVEHSVVALDYKIKAKAQEG